MWLTHSTAVEEIKYIPCTLISWETYQQWCHDQLVIIFFNEVVKLPPLYDLIWMLLLIQIPFTAAKYILRSLGTSN